MEINLIEVEPQMVTSFTMCADPDFKLLNETKEITVSFNKVTKTRLSTSIQFGQYRVKTNLNLDNFNLFEDEGYSYFTGNKTVNYYFVKSKKQDYEVYKQYVKEIVSKVFTDFFKLDIDILTVKLVKNVW